MRVFLVNPSDRSFGTAIITPRWLFVLAGSTPSQYGDPVIVDETLEQMDVEQIQAGDLVGIGIHTGNALRGYALSHLAKARGATIIFGGIHTTLFPDEVFEQAAADAVVKGDGDAVWGQLLADHAAGRLERQYDGGRLDGDKFLPARWDLLPADRYMMASVQTVRGCPKHCSFCSVWRTDGQKPRQRLAEVVVDEVVQLRRLGFRFIVLADDNFYPVTLEDLRLARRQNNEQRLAELTAVREERFELMRRLAELPDDLVFFTQITMEAAEDEEYLKAMDKARVRGALVGVESVTPEGLKAVYKDFNETGEGLVTRLKKFREYNVHILGSFIFGLPTDKPDTFAATVDLAQRADAAFAQFVILAPFPGTVDFLRWEKEQAKNPTIIDGIPITRYWLLPPDKRPKLCIPHPTMSTEEIREGTNVAWERFYSLASTWKRASSRLVRFRSRLTFVLISKFYLQMYAKTGVAADSARRSSANKWARWFGKRAIPLFKAAPMPNLQAPSSESAYMATGD